MAAAEVVTVVFGVDRLSPVARPIKNMHIPVKSRSCAMVVTFLVFLATAPAATQAVSADSAVVAACRDWWRLLDINSAATSVNTPGNGLCINGFIDAGTETGILDSIAAGQDQPPLTVVIRSGGGEFSASMAVAEALERRRPTVIGETICASSCANYIITAGVRRIVWDDSFLLFHGGISLSLMNQVEAQVDALAKEDSNIDRAVARSQMQQVILDQKARQDAFLKRVGVKPEIFEWMNLANGPEAKRHVAACPPDSHVIQFSAAVLARFDLTFSHYGAPRSQVETDALLRKLGRDSKVCYWQDD